MEDNKQELLWGNVLSNCFYLNYPGADGTNKEYDPLRPLYPLLKWLKEMGAILTITKKADGTERMKLEQGTMILEEWNQIRDKQLLQYREKLIWLFAMSLLCGATEEGAKEAERLFRIALVKNVPDAPKIESDQLSLF